MTAACTLVFSTSLYSVLDLKTQSYGRKMEGEIRFCLAALSTNKELRRQHYFRSYHDDTFASWRRMCSATKI